MREKIKPIYSELQGYLSQAPSGDKVAYVRDQSLWEQFNKTIDELNSVSGQDYNKFKITNILHDGSEPYILNSDYRSKLNGLIMRLYGEYFEKEISPFSGGPSTVVNQNQQQSQATQIVMITEFQDLIDKRFYGAELEEKEKSFLQKLKDSLPTVKSVVELVNLILTIAKSSGLDINQISKAFGW
jgi:hypothetical protein